MLHQLRVALAEEFVVDDAEFFARDEVLVAGGAAEALLVVCLGNTDTHLQSARYLSLSLSLSLSPSC